MDSIETLINFYNKSDEEDMYHKVVGHILKNIHKVGQATIYDLADLCYSSPSTISRLVKKLEFESYTDFKSRIFYALKNYRYLNRNTRDVDVAEDEDIIQLYFNFLSNNIAALREEIDYAQVRQISDRFHEAKEVLFYSYPEVQVDILQKALIVSGRRAFAYDSLAAQEGSLGQVKKDTVIFAVVPNLLEIAPVRSVLKKAREKGGFIITVCSEKSNDYKKYSDIQISFNGTKTSMDLYLFRIVTNIIKYDYGRRYVDGIIEELYD